jgi:drug/metabolite transporter (DMT)-like permease
MTEDVHRVPTRFRPLRPASRRRLVAVIVIGPLLWVVAFVVTAWLVKHGDAIGLALLVTSVSLLVALLVLLMLRGGRRREERRYAARR